MTDDTPEGFDRLEAAAAHVPGAEATLDRLRLPLEMRALRLALDRDDGTRLHLRAWRCRWDDALGPTKGGLRFHPGLGAESVARLAFEMTIKCALMELPFGGAKGGVRVDPDRLSPAEASRLARAYGIAFADTIGSDRDIPAPDVGTGPATMGALLDGWSAATGDAGPAAVTGKPQPIGGIAGRDEATAEGGVLLLDHIAEDIGLTRACRVAVQGFGNVGAHAARLLAASGRRIVAVSDSSATLTCPDGLDIEGLAAAKAEGTRLADLDGFAGARAAERDAVLDTQCDVLVPAALAGAIGAERAETLQARAVLELANGPVTEEADAILARRGVTVIPDVLANAGGVTVSWLEWMQNRIGDTWPREEVRARLDAAMASRGRALLALARERELTLREAAYVLALRRLTAATTARG